MKKLLDCLILIRLRYLLKKYNTYNDKIETIYNEFRFTECANGYKNEYKLRTDGYSLYFYLLDKMFIIIRKMNNLYIFHNRLSKQSTHMNYSNDIKQMIETMYTINKEYDLPLLTLTGIWSSYRELYDETIHFYNYKNEYLDHLFESMDKIENKVSEHENQLYNLVQYFNSVLKIVI